MNLEKLNAMPIGACPASRSSWCWHLQLCSFLATGGDLAIYRFWAPKQENAKREVFENTQSYVQGKTEYLSRLRYQYQTLPEGSQKAALRTLILSEASTVDNNKLPADLQLFIQQLKGAI